MPLLRFPKGHGPVTVSLLLPLLTLASSLAFRPVLAPATAEEPAAGAPEVVPMAAPAAAAGSATVEIRTVAFAYHGDDDMPIVLMDPTKGESVGFWHSDGSTALRRLQKTEKARFLWFRSEGRDYVIRDRDLLDRAEAIVEPQSELGRAQGELGGAQGGAGGRQGSLGARQVELGRKLGQLARSEARLRARLHRSSLSAAEERALEAELGEIAERRARAQASVQSLAAGQAKLAARQAALAERQAELGRRQAELSRRITRDLRALVREAMRSGRAVRLGSEVY